jgi:hypothetical protein
LEWSESGSCVSNVPASQTARIGFSRLRTYSTTVRRAKRYHHLTSQKTITNKLNEQCPLFFFYQKKEKTRVRRYFICLVTDKIEVGWLSINRVNEAERFICCSKWDLRFCDTLKRNWLLSIGSVRSTGYTVILYYQPYLSFSLVALSYYLEKKEKSLTYGFNHLLFRWRHFRDRQDYRPRAKSVVSSGCCKIVRFIMHAGFLHDEKTIHTQSPVQ